MEESLTEPAKLLLLASLLAKDRIITNNGKAFLKELILRRDPRLGDILRKFESKEANDAAFLEKIHQVIEEEAYSLYQDLFSDCSLEMAKTLSKSERDQKNLNEEKSLIYGEVEFSSFVRVLRKINPSPNGIFYDLGSGTGKAVFVARFTQDFARCCGIEILESLYNASRVIVDKFNTEFRPYLCSTQSENASVFQGSFLEYDWSDGDVVFANSTCFDDELMDGLSVSAERMKPGSFVVTFTKGLNSNKFEVLERKRYKMSWGPATVFIHRRLNADGTSVGPKTLNTLPSDAASYVEDDDDLDLDAADDDDDDDDDGGNAEEDQENGEDAEDDAEEEDDDDIDEEEVQGGGTRDLEEDEKEEEEQTYRKSMSFRPQTLAEKRLGINPRPMLSAPGTEMSQSPLGSPHDTMLLRRKRSLHQIKCTSERLDVQIWEENCVF